MKREYFLPPKGWDWEGEWMVDPERRSDSFNFIQAGIKELTSECRGKHPLSVFFTGKVLR